MGNQGCIVITGGTGYLGSHLVRRLQDAPGGVVVLTRARSNTRRLEGLRCRQVRMDEREPEQILRSLGRVDAMVHCATDYGRAGQGDETVFQANTVTPLRWLAAACAVEVPTFVNTDTALPHETSAYSLSKAQFREWARRSAARGEIGFLNLRLEHFYGAGDDASKFTTHVIRSCLAGVEELSLTPGKQQRDFVHVDDVVEAYALLLGLTATTGWREFDVGSGVPVTIRTFVETVKRLTNAPTRLTFGALPYRAREPMQSAADTRPLRALGWVPCLGLEDGLRRTIDEERTL